MAFAQTRKTPKAKCFVSVVDHSSAKDVELIETQGFVKQVDLIVPVEAAAKFRESKSRIHVYTATCPLRTLLTDQFLASVRNGM
jgi:hypothetical protein